MKKSVETSLSELLKMAADRGIRYRETLTDHRVSPAPEAVARLLQLGGALPEHPTAADTILAMLDDIGSPATVRMSGGGILDSSTAVPCPPRWPPTGWPALGIKTALWP